MKCGMVYVDLLSPGYVILAVTKRLRANFYLLSCNLGLVQQMMQALFILCSLVQHTPSVIGINQFLCARYL
jgi:hypothetical protein